MKVWIYFAGAKASKVPVDHYEKKTVVCAYYVFCPAKRKLVVNPCDNGLFVSQSIHFIVRQFRAEFNYDVSFAPPAAVWIALNPTQVTSSFTGSSDFHLIPPLVTPTIQVCSSVRMSVFDQINESTCSFLHFLLRPLTQLRTLIRLVRGGKTPPPPITIPQFDPSLCFTRHVSLPQNLMLSSTVHVFITNMLCFSSSHVISLVLF